MSSDKSTIQNFANFNGLDERSSDLTRPINAAKAAENFIIESNFSLGGEKGLHMFARSADSIFFIGTHTYKYQDPDTGRQAEELIAIGPKNASDGSGLYRLKEGTFTITYSGGNLWGYEFLVDATNNDLRLFLYDNDVEVLEASVGTGVEDDSTGITNLGSLEATIDAVSNFTATSDATVDAIVAAAFPLSADYDLSAGAVNFSVWYWEEVTLNTVTPTGSSPFYGAVYNHDRLAAKPPIFKNQNNCCYITCDGYTHFMKYDGVGLRQVGLMSIFKDDVALSTSASATVAGTFYYYLRLVTRDAKGNFIYGAGAYTDSVTVVGSNCPTVEVFNTSIMSSQGYIVDLGDDTTTPGTSNTASLDSFDNEDFLEDRGFGSLSPGDFLFFSQTGDVRQVTSIDREAETITFDGEAVDFSSGSQTAYWANAFFMGTSYITTNSAQANVSDITTTSISGVEAGTWLWFNDEQRWFKVTEVSGSTVTIDGIVSIPSGGYQAADTAVEVWRTENGGVDKFYYSMSKNILGAFNNAFADTTTDANLAEELIAPTKEPDAIFKAPGVFTQHQGIMVLASGWLRSGRIHFEDIEYKESFPAAVNFYDLPSQDAGIISALWSDTYDQLAVFQDSAYYSVVGSMRDEIPILNTIANAENDLGISGQASLVKIRGLNIGIGPLGFVAFKNGEIDYQFTKQLDSLFLAGNVGEVFTESQKLRTHKAIAVNDKFKQQAYFFVPAMNVSGAAHTGANNNSKIFILDYSERTWTTRNFPDDLSAGSSGLIPFPFLPTAGMAIYNDRLFMHSNAYDSTIGNGDYTDFRSFLFRRKEREVTTDTVSDYRYDYSDQHKAINYDYKSQWFFLEPAEDGLFHWLKLYVFPTADFVPFDLQVRTYIDWDDSTVIDNQTISFTSSSYQHTLKLSANKAETLLVRLSTNTVLEKPTITGYQVVLGDLDGRLEGVR